MTTNQDATVTDATKYIPSTTLVMETFAVAGVRTRGKWTAEDYHKFNAARDVFMGWLTDHDAKIAAQAKAEALREAAEEMNAKYEAVDYGHWRGRDYCEGKEIAYDDACDWLRARAATIDSDVNQ